MMVYAACKVYPKTLAWRDIDKCRVQLCRRSEKSMTLRFTDAWLNTFLTGITSIAPKVIQMRLRCVALERADGITELAKFNLIPTTFDNEFNPKINV